MDPDIAFGVELRGLGAAFESGHLWEDCVEQAGGIEQIESMDPVRMQKDTGQFFADAFWADLVDGGSVFLYGLECFWIDGEAEHGCEANGAEEAEAILSEPFAGVADGADDVGVEICSSGHMIDHGIG